MAIIIILFVKGGKLGNKRRQTKRQKAAFCTAKGRLLDKRVYTVDY